MSSSAGLLEFFILEAGEYIERLDSLAGANDPQGPPPEDFVRQARALRGSATMVKLPNLAEVASALERIGRGLADGSVTWGPGVSGAVIGAIDDLKILVRAVRTWGSREDDLARERANELVAFAPARGAAAPVASQPASAGLSYMADEARQVATGITAVLSSPENAESLGALLARVRRLRGIAALRDLPPLPEVLESVERAVRPLENGSSTLPPPARELLASAMALLLRVAGEMASGDKPSTEGEDLNRFAAAAAAVEEDSPDGDRIVPVSELFFNDEGPHVVERSSNPPTTPAARFRLEVVSIAEHLRRLVADARRAADPATRDRLGRELRASIRALRQLAESFGERDVLGFVDSLGDAPARLDRQALERLERAAVVLAETRADSQDVSRTLGQLTQRDAGSPEAQVPPVEHRETPPAPAVSAGAPGGTPAMIANGLAGLKQLEENPLSEPVEYSDDTVVPIESLLYRGRAALDRALELRASIRAALVGDAPPPREEMDELLDLLELVGTE